MQALTFKEISPSKSVGFSAIAEASGAPVYQEEILPALITLPLNELERTLLEINIALLNGLKADGETSALAKEEAIKAIRVLHLLMARLYAGRRIDPVSSEDNRGKVFKLANEFRKSLRLSEDEKSFEQLFIELKKLIFLSNHLFKESSEKAMLVSKLKRIQDDLRLSDGNQTLDIGPSFKAPIELSMVSRDLKALLSDALWWMEKGAVEAQKIINLDWVTLKKRSEFQELLLLFFKQSGLLFRYRDEFDPLGLLFVMRMQFEPLMPYIKGEGLTNINDAFFLFRYMAVFVSKTLVVERRDNRKHLQILMNKAREQKEHCREKINQFRQFSLVGLCDQAFVRDVDAIYKEKEGIERFLQSLLLQEVDLFSVPQVLFAHLYVILSRILGSHYISMKSDSEAFDALVQELAFHQTRLKELEVLYEGVSQIELIKDKQEQCQAAIDSLRMYSAYPSSDHVSTFFCLVFSFLDNYVVFLQKMYGTKMSSGEFFASDSSLASQLRSSVKAVTQRLFLLLKLDLSDVRQHVFAGSELAVDEAVSSAGLASFQIERTIREEGLLASLGLEEGVFSQINRHAYFRAFSELMDRWRSEIDPNFKEDALFVEARMWDILERLTTSKTEDLKKIEARQDVYNSLSLCLRNVLAIPSEGVYSGKLKSFITYAYNIFIQGTEFDVLVDRLGSLDEGEMNKGDIGWLFSRLDSMLENVGPLIALNLRISTRRVFEYADLKTVAVLREAREELSVVQQVLVGGNYSSFSVQYAQWLVFCLIKKIEDGLYASQMGLLQSLISSLSGETKLSVDCLKRSLEELFKDRVLPIRSLVQQPLESLMIDLTREVVNGLFEDAFSLLKANIQKKINEAKQLLDKNPHVSKDIRGFVEEWMNCVDMLISSSRKERVGVVMFITGIGEYQRVLVKKLQKLELMKFMSRFDSLISKASLSEDKDDEEEVKRRSNFELEMSTLRSYTDSLSSWLEIFSEVVLESNSIFSLKAFLESKRSELEQRSFGSFVGDDALEIKGAFQGLKSLKYSDAKAEFKRIWLTYFPGVKLDEEDARLDNLVRCFSLKFGKGQESTYECFFRGVRGQALACGVVSGTNAMGKVQAEWFSLLGSPKESYLECYKAITKRFHEAFCFFSAHFLQKTT